MTIDSTHPALILFGAAFLCLFLPSLARRLLLLIAPVLALGFIIMLPAGNHLEISFLNYELFPLNVDRLSRLFGVIFALITAISAVYSLSFKERGEQVAKLLYAAGSLGVVFAADYLTLYVFWELMALSSFYLIAARREESSRQAALRYLFMHLVGGVALLGGILLLAQENGTLLIFSFAPDTNTLSAWLILVGFTLNAAAVPLHVWLPDSYPKSTVTGGVLLSALTTKTALYALARVYPGWDILIVVGIVMALYGVFFAFLADDIREVLAYHIISQVGYMVAGVGLGTETAINGAVAHAFCHILYKALLFMGAGAVLYATGKSRLSSLGGLMRLLPWVFIFYMVGAVSISGFPLFNGFISKSMVVAGYEEAGLIIGALLLEAAAVGTFLSVGLKLPYFTWFGPKYTWGGWRKESPWRPATGRALTRGLRVDRTRPSETSDVQAIPKSMYWGMGIAAFLCLLLGIRPELLYSWLPYPTTYQPYTAPHVIHICELLVATALGFFLLLPKLKTAVTITLDVDWFYRRPKDLFYLLFVEAPGKVFDRSERLALEIAHKLSQFSQNPSAKIAALIDPKIEAKLPFDSDRQRRPIAWTAGAILATFIFLGIWLLFDN